MGEEKLAYYIDQFNHRWFVGQKPGQGGKDWGWVFHAGQAQALSAYWQRRFASWCRYVGRTPHFI